MKYTWRIGVTYLVSVETGNDVCRNLIRYVHRNIKREYKSTYYLKYEKYPIISIDYNHVVSGW